MKKIKVFLLVLGLAMIFPTICHAQATITRLKILDGDLHPKITGASIELDNNVYYIGTDVAGTGEINLIKANASDQAEVGVVLAVPDGTAALPAYTFTSDPNTGLELNSADELSLIAGGTEGLRIDFNELEVQPLMT